MADFDEYFSNLDNQTGRTEKNKNLSICSNCCSPFYPSQSFNEGDVVSQRDWEMLSTIYKLNYASSSYHQNTNTNSLLILCLCCKQVLHELFSIFCKFNQLRHLESQLSREIQNVDNILINSQQHQEQQQNDNQSAKRLRLFSFSTVSGPWVKIGPRLEEMEFEEIGYKPRRSDSRLKSSSVFQSQSNFQPPPPAPLLKEEQEEVGEQDDNGDDDQMNLGTFESEDDQMNLGTFESEDDDYIPSDEEKKKKKKKTMTMSKKKKLGRKLKSSINRKRIYISKKKKKDNSEPPVKKKRVWKRPFDPDRIEKYKDYTPLTKISDTEFMHGQWQFTLLPNGKYACGSCKVMRICKYRMKQHIKQIHEGIFPFICQVPDCGVGIDTVSKFVTHHVKVHAAKFGQQEYQFVPCAEDRVLVDGTWAYQKIQWEPDVNENSGENSTPPSKPKVDVLFKCLHCILFKCESEQTMIDHLRNHPYRTTSSKEQNETPKDSSIDNQEQQQIPADKNEENSKTYKNVPFVKNQGGGKFMYLDKYPFEHSMHGFKCMVEKCKRVYPTRIAVLRHIRHKHCLGQFVCEKCGKECVSDNIRRKHWCNPKKYGQTLEISPGQFEYEYEDKKFYFDQMGEACFKCSLCDVIRKSKEGLTNHVREKHMGIVYTCDKCGRSFTRKVAFDGHVATHYDLRPFICEVCGKTYKCAHDLAKHRRLTHRPADKEFKCELCDAILSTSVSLNRHKKTRHPINQNQMNQNPIPEAQFQYIDILNFSQFAQPPPQ